MSEAHLFQAIQFSQRVLKTQLNICIDFDPIQLNEETVLFLTIKFSVSTVLMSKSVLFQKIQFSISTQFTCQNGTFSSSSV